MLSLRSYLHAVRPICLLLLARRTCLRTVFLSVSSTRSCSSSSGRLLFDYPPLLQHRRREYPLNSICALVMHVGRATPLAMPTSRRRRVSPGCDAAPLARQFEGARRSAHAARVERRALNASHLAPIIRQGAGRRTASIEARSAVTAISCTAGARIVLGRHDLALVRGARSRSRQGRVSAKSAHDTHRVYRGLYFFPFPSSPARPYPSKHQTTNAQCREHLPRMRTS